MKNLILLLTAGTSLCAQGQQRNANWLMRNENWISFSSGIPVTLPGPATYLSALNHGCLSNTSGDLLFHSDQVMIYNAAHAAIQGVPHPDSIPYAVGESRLFLPKPGAPDRYYLFFNGYNVNGQMLSYLEVDMTLDGGLGGVVGGFTHLVDSTTQHLAATTHGNGTDYWLLVHKRFSDAFLAYQVTGAGVDPVPVVSHVGSVAYQMYMGVEMELNVGASAFSLDGSQYVWAAHDDFAATPDALELFDFDVLSGVLTLKAAIPVPVAPGNADQLMGVEFSPADARLYVHRAFSLATPCSPCNVNQVSQYTITDDEVAAIVASRVILASDTLTGIQGGLHTMEMARDGKIYVRRYQGSSPAAMWLDAISFPDLEGSSCGYVEEAFQMTGLGSVHGLPVFCKQYHDDPALTVGFSRPPAAPGRMNIQPNPMTDVAWIELPPLAGQGTLTLRDATGRLLQSRRVQNGSQRILLQRDGLAPGVYLVELHVGDTHLGSGRMVIE